MARNGRRRIAVVGGGAAGIGASFYASAFADVVLFEAAHLGGHARTYTIPCGDDRGLNLDLAFMVFNDKNYPNLLKFFDDVGGVPTQPTEMSFGYFDERDQFGYALNWSPDNAFARQHNLSAGFYLQLGRLVKQILKFQRRTLADLEDGALGEATLWEYLDRCEASQELRDRYLAPMSAAIWSAPSDSMREFPAAPFFRFFQNHGLLSPAGDARWRHIPGGSRRYIEAFRRAAPNVAVRNHAVRSILRDDSGVTLVDAAGEGTRADLVVLAVHADAVEPLLGDADAREKAAFRPWRYQLNHAVLHCDESVMPPDRRNWASWNYRETGSAAGMVVTYHLNRLQNLTDCRRSYFVTLSPDAAALSSVAPEKILERLTFSTPLYTPAALASRAAIDALQGLRRTHYCGSYMGHGFHEDALESGKAAAAAIERA